MIQKIGKIYLDPSEIDGISEELNTNPNNKERGVQVIQVVFKNGVVKNYKSSCIGMNYNEFCSAIDKIIKKTDKEELITLMMLSNLNNYGKNPSNT